MLAFQSARESLRKHNQEHLLTFFAELDEPERASLLSQLGEIDFQQLDDLIRSYLAGQTQVEIPKDIMPAPILPAAPKPGRGTRAEASAAEQLGLADAGADLLDLYRRARRRGRELISAGKVAALVVAGGAGTRLGFAGPKGCLPATPVKRKTLFRLFAEQMLATGRLCRTRLPWYVMTSRDNDAATRKFFDDNDFLGLNRDDVTFFRQGRMPTVGTDGKLLLARKHEIAMNPDGHGGSLAALHRSGALEDMARRGVEYVSYFQVDNPLVRCLDPLFIGLHAQAAADVSAKALPKRHPLEKLGNFCVADGKVAVIEYSDLPEELAYATRDDGTLLFGAGSIAIHVFSRSFIEHLTGGSCRLPLHCARKKVAHVGPTGVVVEPAEPNAVKFEMFVFDAMPLADKVLLLETARGEEFSPIKNADGEDSIATSLRDQVRRAANWLESAGVRAPRDANGEIAAAIEISPLFALDAAQLAEKVDAGMTIKPGDQVYLE